MTGARPPAAHAGYVPWSLGAPCASQCPPVGGGRIAQINEVTKAVGPGSAKWVGPQGPECPLRGSLHVGARLEVHVAPPMRVSDPEVTYTLAEAMP